MLRTIGASNIKTFETIAAIETIETFESIL